MTGTELAEIRARLGLTQTEFAGRLGIHSNSLARWERGEVSISELAARRACEVYVRARGGAAKAKAIRRELGPRRVGSTSRPLALSAADRAERQAIRDLRELLGKDALEWFDR